MTRDTISARVRSDHGRSSRVSHGNAFKLGLLVLTTAALTGCPMAIGDPVSRSQITNDTGAPVELELTLDTQHVYSPWNQDAEPEQYATWWNEEGKLAVEEELQSYALRGTGVALTATDPDNYTGTYELAPSATLVVHEAMGMEAYHRLDTLTVTREGEAWTCTGAQQIVSLFERVDGDQFVWEFKVSDAR